MRRAAIANGAMECLRRGRVSGGGRSAFTLVEIMIVIGVIGIILAIALPGWLRARARGRAVICQQNLVQIDGAKEVWAFENKKSIDDPVEVADLVAPDQTGFLRKTPFCPQEGDYTAQPVGTRPTCSVNIEGLEEFIDHRYLHVHPAAR